MQIADTDHVVINQHESADAGADQILCNGAAEPADAHQEGVRSGQTLLTRRADFRQQQLAGISFFFFHDKFRGVL